ncbi:hypothetical protein [Streptomyces sp. NPDC058240]|uniref:hypothetical protein n=1 Tax=Streptomyces sp. NPDC058240 TaxID=3346396 RepID=UPI0036E092F9
MGRVPSWLRKPLFIGVPLVSVATGAVFFLDADRSDGSGHAAANRAQLKRACAGLLVANGITAAQKCGGSPLRTPTRVVDTYEARVTTDADGGTWRSWGSTSRAWA